MNKKLNIFKAGTHTAASGATIGFSEDDLRAAASAYDPAIHEAPIVVGHPAHDLPAYGWVAGLEYSESTGLEADPSQVEAQFAELEEAGRFKKISASFYVPESPANPVPGVYYLRHVGFLGSQPPAIKGLRDAAFAEDEEGIVEFSDAYTTGLIARTFRNLREWIIGKDGLEEADKVLPDYVIADLEDEARHPSEPEKHAVGFNEPNDPNGSKTMTEDELKAAQEKLAADQETHNNNVASFAETQKADAKAARHDKHMAKVADPVKQGKVLPAQKDGLVAFMDTLSGDTAVEFGEGDQAVASTADGFIDGFLDGLNPAVDFGEHSSEDGHDADETVTAEELSGRAVAYMEKMKGQGVTMNIVQAMTAIENGKDK